jgi:hypothetical protein
MIVLWDVALRSLIGTALSFRGDYCLHQQDDQGNVILMMEEACQVDCVQEGQME